MLEFCFLNGIHTHSEKDVSYYNVPTIVGHIIWQIGKLLESDSKPKEEKNLKTPKKGSSKAKTGLMSPKYVLFNGEQMQVV